MRYILPTSASRRTTGRASGAGAGATAGAGSAAAEAGLENVGKGTLGLHEPAVAEERDDAARERPRRQRRPLRRLAPQHDPAEVLDHRGQGVALQEEPQALGHDVDGIEDRRQEEQDLQAER